MSYRTAYEYVPITDEDEAPVPLVQKLPPREPDRKTAPYGWPAQGSPRAADEVRTLFRRTRPSMNPPPATQTAPEAMPVPPLVEDPRTVAEREGLKAARDKVEMVIGSYLDGVSRLHDATRQMGRPSAHEVVSLALVVAREIIGREVSINQNLLVEKLDEVLKSVQAESSIVVRMGPADLSYVKLLRPDLLERGMAIVEDKNISAGGCIVETPTRIYDTTVEARLEAVRSSLTSIVAEAASAAPTPSDPKLGGGHV